MHLEGLLLFVGIVVEQEVEAVRGRAVRGCVQVQGLRPCPGESETGTTREAPHTAETEKTDRETDARTHALWAREHAAGSSSKGIGGAALCVRCDRAAQGLLGTYRYDMCFSSSCIGW